MHSGEPPSFATSSGHCVITPEALLLEAHSAQSTKFKSYASIPMRPFVQAAIGASLFACAGVLFRPGMLALALLIAFFGLLFFLGALQNRRLSATNRILRQDIVEIRDHPPFPVRSAYFSIRFKTANGIRERHVTLPFAIKDRELAYYTASNLLRGVGPTTPKHP